MNFFRERVSDFLYKMFSFSVARSLCGSFAIAIIIGSFFLFISEKGDIKYIDALYLSTSAICVTGLSPLNLSDLNFSSQFILMFLIQIGGIGIITFTVIIGLLVVKGISRSVKLTSFISEAIDMADSDEEKTLSSKQSNKYVYRILFSILNISLTLELIGAIFLYRNMPDITQLIGQPNRVFLSIFTSISAFNNAGFSIVNDISFLAKEPKCLFIIELLIILGGIGFPVILFLEKIILDITRKIIDKLEIRMETIIMRRAIQGKDPYWIYLFLGKISISIEKTIQMYKNELRGESNKIQTKVILYGSLVLILIGGFSILIMEFDNPNTLGQFDLVHKISNAFFLSVSSRTAGFQTFDLSSIKNSTFVMLSSLMFIGGSPQGAAGGIKITTFIILVMYLVNVINPQKKVSIFGEKVSKNSVAVSIRIYFLVTTSIVTFLFITSFLNGNQLEIEMIFFEIISAFGTVGLSMGLTPKIDSMEKIVYIYIMYIGRVGAFTLLVALTGRSGVGQLGEEDDGIKIQVG